jgi:hypothetical protein
MQIIIRLILTMAALFVVRLPMALNRATRRFMGQRSPTIVMHGGYLGFWGAGGRFVPLIAGGAGAGIHEMLKFSTSLNPVADAFAGTANSDVHNMAGFDQAMFVLHSGVGATGTSVITVEACDNVTPSNTTAIAFWYREITSGDTDGAWTRATSAGFTTTAGSNRITQIVVDASDVAAASVNSTVGNKFVRLNLVEGTDNPVLGGILFIGVHGRYQEDINPTTLA